MNGGPRTTLSAMHAAAWLALFALVAVMSAGLWHHHEQGAAAHPDCTVCVAASGEKSDGLPAPRMLGETLPLVGTVAILQSRRCGVQTPGLCLARGPPAA